MVAEARAGPQHARAPHGAPEGFDRNNTTLGAVHPAATATLAAGASSGSPLRHRAGASPHGHQGQPQVPEVQGVVHPGQGSDAATPDAYVPRMMDLEYTHEKKPSLFPEPSWAEGTLEAGAFHEPPESFAGLHRIHST